MRLDGKDMSMRVKTVLMGLAALVVFASTGYALPNIETLWLSPAPAGKPGGPPAGGHDHGGSSGSHDPGRTGRPAGAGSGAIMLEPEHRPTPMRAYLLNDRNGHGEIDALVRRADGTVEAAALEDGVVRFKLPMGDGPAHGANNLYVTEKWLEPDNVLVVRVAKWITMHHSCGWGHDRKFDEQRINPQHQETVPLEIVLDDLWDTSFHARLRSGDDLNIRVLAAGKPVAEAKVKVHSRQGWTKELVTDANGAASVQMIRDYYPRIWSEFNSTHREPLLVAAFYETDESGSFGKQPYTRVRYSASISWNYQPARRDFSSYVHGLLVALVVMVVSGFGVWIFRERRKRPYRGVVFDE